MKEVEYFFWMLPPDTWSKKPRRSRWRMSREDAAQRGLTEPVLSSREVRLMPETEEERIASSRANSTAAFRRWWEGKPKEPPDGSGKA